MRLLMSALRIAIAVAIINGVVRTAAVYWSFYQFEDAAQQLAIFGWQTPTDVLKSTVAAKAGELQVPIVEDQISVARDGPITRIEASYQHPVEYFPNRQYPLQLKFKVEGRNLAAGATR